MLRVSRQDGKTQRLLANVRVMVTNLNCGKRTSEKEGVTRENIFVNFFLGQIAPIFLMIRHNENKKNIHSK